MGARSFYFHKISSLEARLLPLAVALFLSYIVCRYCPATTSEIAFAV